MARIAGVNIPSQKVRRSSYLCIWSRKKVSIDVCEKANVDSNTRVNDLSESEIKNISDVIASSFLVEGDLRREVSGNIKRLKDLGTYRGVRHRKNLPCRGQRTHTNARTKKGKAIAIAGKKKVTK